MDRISYRMHTRKDEEGCMVPHRQERLRKGAGFKSSNLSDPRHAAARVPSRTRSSITVFPKCREMPGDAGSLRSDGPEIRSEAGQRPREPPLHPSLYW
eukprot:1191080-Prorocentrum_minimum.AAC.8